MCLFQHWRGFSDFTFVVFALLGIWSESAHHQDDKLGRAASPSATLGAVSPSTLLAGRLRAACGTSWPLWDALINPHTKRNTQIQLYVDGRKQGRTDMKNWADIRYSFIEYCRAEKQIDFIVQSDVSVTREFWFCFSEIFFSEFRFFRFLSLFSEFWEKSQNSLFFDPKPSHA